jgi:hypothetical protein
VDPAALGRMFLNSISSARICLLKTAPNAYIAELAANTRPRAAGSTLISAHATLNSEFGY